MGVNYNNGSPITLNGLILLLDSANKTSYPGSGSTWYDLSGNRNHATILNNPSVMQHGIIFNGINQYAHILNANNFNMSGKNFCIEVWISILDSNANERPILEYNLLQNNGSYIVTTFNNLIRFTFYDAYNNNKKIDYTHTPLTTGAWTQIISQFSTDNNTLELFINGTKVAQQTGVTEEIGNINDNLYILGHGGSLNFLRARLSGLFIYNKTLSNDEIANNYFAFKRRFIK